MTALSCDRPFVAAVVRKERAPACLARACATTDGKGACAMRFEVLGRDAWGSDGVTGCMLDGLQHDECQVCAWAFMVV